MLVGDLMLIIYYYIRDFFLFVGGTIKFIFDLIMSIIDVVKASGNWLIDIIQSLPLILVVPLVALVIIAILYKVLGRESQS